MTDCYFFIDMDSNVPEEERTISTLCVPCHEKDYPDTGWFYEGSKEGYGPFNYVCCRCGTYIHKAEDDADEAELEN